MMKTEEIRNTSLKEALSMNMMTEQPLRKCKLIMLIISVNLKFTFNTMVERIMNVVNKIDYTIAHEPLAHKTIFAYTWLCCLPVTFLQL